MVSDEPGFGTTEEKLHLAHLRAERPEEAPAVPYMGLESAGLISRELQAPPNFPKRRPCGHVSYWQAGRPAGRLGTPGTER